MLKARVRVAALGVRGAESKAFSFRFIQYFVIVGVRVGVLLHSFSPRSSCGSFVLFIRYPYEATLNPRICLTFISGWVRIGYMTNIYLEQIMNTLNIYLHIST